MEPRLHAVSGLGALSSPLPSFPQTWLGRSQKVSARRRFRSVVLISCSSSRNSGPEELAEVASRPDDVPASPPSSSSSRGSGIANFRPPPPSAPLNSESLRTELPFQHWYSYSDLPPGASKKRFRNPNARKRPPREGAHFASSSVEARDSGMNSSRLWLAIRSEEGQAGGFDSEPRGRRPLPGTCREGKGGAVVSSPVLEEKFRKARAFGRQCELSGTVVDEAGACAVDLSANDMKELIRTCEGSSRQINIGWGGWKPAYVSLIHSYWKRSRVCKIVCKGLVTVDMESMCRKLEVETGGKVVGRRGGVVYLFRGLGYDFWRDARRLYGGRRSEPAFQIPKRLPVPSSLSKSDVISLRLRAPDFPALTRLARNGVYLTLVDDIRKALETQDLVRVNCQDLHPRNLKHLAFKLQALVPCELISFEFEHIMMSRKESGEKLEP